MIPFYMKIPVESSEDLMRIRGYLNSYSK